MKALFIALFLCPLAQAAEAPKAFYEVPVEKELMKFASYEIDYFAKAVTGNKLEMSYQLPLELTGKPQIVTFSGEIVDGRAPIILRGPRGEMECGLKESSVQTCAVKYHDIEVDLEQVAHLLDVRKADAEEKAGKLRVAGSFRESGGDIGGIITYVNAVPAYRP